MKQVALRIALLGALSLLPRISAGVDGYGPWKFGMTPDQVSAVEELGPYSPVQATGGLETSNGEFMGETVPISFVFNDDGLYHCQIWVYTGKEFSQAAAGFYLAYRHLEEHFGPVLTGDAALPEDLDERALIARIPSSFRDNSDAVSLEEPGPGEEIELNLQPRRLHLRPQRPLEEGEVHASLIHSSQLGTYWVFVFYRGTPSRGSAEAD